MEAIITQLLEVTAHLHSLNLSLDQLDLSTIMIKGNFIKLGSFGLSMIPLKDK